MPEEFLSICIPTRNRCARLAGLLTRLEDEINRHQIPMEILRVYVSDNTSTDATHATVQGFLQRFKHLTYLRHPKDIGAGRNFLSCAQQASGIYCWIVGDDDLVNPDALLHILEILRRHRPALFLNYDGRYESGLRPPVIFPGFQEFASACVRANPHMLVAHSLITANIFDRSRYDPAFAQSMINTFYGHMYGLVSGLVGSPGGIYLTERHTITVRDSSVDPLDGVTWDYDLDTKWAHYLAWLKTRFDLPKLRPEAIAEYTRLALRHEFRAHPLRFCLRYSRSLLRPQTYKTLWRLLRPPHAFVKGILPFAFHGGRQGITGKIQG